MCGSGAGNALEGVLSAQIAAASVSHTSVWAQSVGCLTGLFDMLLCELCVCALPCNVATLLHTAEKETHPHPSVDAARCRSGPCRALGTLPPVPVHHCPHRTCSTRCGTPGGSRHRCGCAAGRCCQLCGAGSAWARAPAGTARTSPCGALTRAATQVRSGQVRSVHQ